ncbi:MAG: CHAT domain-containing protein [Bacteroidota bacterium]
MEKFVDDLKKLIVKKGLGDAFEKLTDLGSDQIGDELYNQVITLNRRHNQLEEEISFGYVDIKDGMHQRRILLKSVMDLLDRIKKYEPDDPILGEGKKPKSPSPSTRKILFLAANPTDTGKLRLGAELRDIEEGLKLAEHRDAFELESRFAVRAKDLSRAMLEEEPRIVHFSGHGVKFEDGKLTSDEHFRFFSWEKGEEEEKLKTYGGGIALEDSQGKAKLVSSKALGDLFELFKEQIECVLLNACYSEAQADEILKHIPYVIGMNTAVPDETAIVFAVGFYDALGAGRDIEFAFKLAKNRIALEGLSGADIPVIRKREE